MDVICDTNVWYDLGSGALKASDIGQPGNRLIATPVSFLEIASKLTDKTITERRNAAKAVVTIADDVIQDPERHLAQIWQLPLEPLAVDWKQGFKAIADATTLSELETGVSDFNEVLRDG